MNNSRFTTKDIKKVVYLIIAEGKGYVTSSTHGENLSEFSPDDDITIEEVDEGYKGMIYVRFKQELGDYEEMTDYTGKYELVETIPNIEKYLNNK